MGNVRVQVSKDGGATWKFIWADPAVFDPLKSSLTPGDLIRRSPEAAEIREVGIKEGKLTTYLTNINKRQKYIYQISDNTIEITATSQSIADYLLINRLLESGLLKRSSCSDQWIMCSTCGGTYNSNSAKCPKCN